ncbi:MAG: ATP-binding protein [Pseudomonadota bacterium]|nr:ATP-binding protein [Pseudomonadota bacterium]
MKQPYHNNRNINTQPSSWLSRRSLNQRLLILLLSATVTVWTVSSISIYWTVKHEAQEIFDQALAETAHALLSLHVGHFQHDQSTNLPDIAHGQHSERIVFQIWRRDGQLLYRSTGISSEPIIPLIAPTDDETHESRDQDIDSDDAYALIKINREIYRSFVAWDQHGQFQVQIAERDDIRQQIFDETAMHLLNIALLFLPILALLILILVKISLRPLQQLTQRIDMQAIDDLQPIQPQQTPPELRPMVDALNQLLHKINQSFERERRFTANAAHELRTPLAAIRLHAQVLQGARNPTEAVEAALDIQHGVDRCTRLMEQLLVLARLDPQHQANEQQPLDLAQQIATVATQHAYLLEQQHITLQLNTPPTPVIGNPDQIEILLRNLLDNAIRYGGTHKSIWISCGLNAQQQAYLSIEDQGIGIPPTKRDRVFDRFYRLPDATSTGSGLGLSIVGQIAQLHQAKIKISHGRDQRGTCFTVTFPALS